MIAIDCIKCGGRGNKGMAQQVAERVGISKRSVSRDVEAASAAIGEKINLDCDTPEELKRKAAELERRGTSGQRAERKIVRLKRRKQAPRDVIEDPKPAEPHAWDIGSRWEACGGPSMRPAGRTSSGSSMTSACTSAWTR